MQILWVQKDPYVWNALMIRGYEYWNRGDQIIKRFAPEKAKEMGAKTKFSAKESADAMSYMAMA